MGRGCRTPFRDGEVSKRQGPTLGGGGVLPHAKGQGHHRRASANGATGTDPPEFLRSNPRPPPPRHGVRAREPGYDDGEVGKALPQNGDFPGEPALRPALLAVGGGTARTQFQARRGGESGWGREPGRAAWGQAERPGGEREWGWPLGGRGAGGEAGRGGAGGPASGLRPGRRYSAGIGWPSPPEYSSVALVLLKLSPYPWSFTPGVDCPS